MEEPKKLPVAASQSGNTETGTEVTLQPQPLPPRRLQGSR